MRCDVDKFKDLAAGILCLVVVANILTVDVYLLQLFAQGISLR